MTNIHTSAALTTLASTGIICQWAWSPIVSGISQSITVRTSRGTSLVPRPLSDLSRWGLATRNTLSCPKEIQSVTQSLVNAYTRVHSYLHAVALSAHC